MVNTPKIANTRESIINETKDYRHGDSHFPAVLCSVAPNNIELDQHWRFISQVEPPPEPEPNDPEKPYGDEQVGIMKTLLIKATTHRFHFMPIQFIICAISQNRMYNNNTLLEVL
jgi:hypothetical protein